MIASERRQIMPWTETRIMDARVKFVSEVLEGIYTMLELCRAYQISRKTGYKWLITDTKK
jgi:transposase-like protein